MVKLAIEDITVGQSLPVLIKHPTTRQLVMFAGAAEEFYELHYDKDFALDKGFPGVIVHGMLMGSFLGQLMTGWIGDEGTLKRFKVNYLASAYPGQELTCKGVVTGKYTESGENLVACDIWLENARGEKAVAGAAVVSLPSKGVNSK